MEKRLLHYSAALLIFIIFSKNSFSQGETNIWYFGNNAGLDFNSGIPVALTNGQIYTDEGCSVISDASGNLLFYTDGISVWNKTHWQMPNGYSLAGGHSSTQSAIIVKKPGNNFIYYIFTANQQYSGNGIKYSEVNMTLNGGLGDVTLKNISMHTPSCEKITAVRHCNGQDVWVITHDWNSDAFRAFLITSLGVSSMVVVSNAGLFLSGNENNKIGYLKASPDGSRLASAVWGSDINRFEVFDFNRSTGIVSNGILFPSISAASGAYGVEFSPDGTKLYGSVLSPGRIYQFNLCAGSNTAIANSGILVGITTALLPGALQLGPDNKIYLAKYFSETLGIINYPNELGTACNFVDIGVFLNGKFSSIGLPNFISGNSRPPVNPFSFSVHCNTAAFSAPAISPASCSSPGNPVTGMSWNFGDTVSGSNNNSVNTNPVHTFINSGTYTVTLVLNYMCGTDTLHRNISIPNDLNFGEIITEGNSVCIGSSTTLNGNGGTSYLWNTGENSAAITVSPLVTTEYSVIVNDGTGCMDTVSTVIVVKQKPEASINGKDTLCRGNQAELAATGGTSWLWNTGDTSSSIIVEPVVSSVYSVIVSNGACSDTTMINIYIKDIPEINTNTGHSGETYTEFNVSGGISYQWFPSEGLSCNTCSDPVASPAETTTYCVTVTGRNGCTASAYLDAVISIIYIPNAFSPDDNNINDIFKPVIKNVHKYQFLIFNRWGDKIFQTSDPEEGWTGYYKGNLCEQSSYVYKINFVDDERKAFHEYTGSVTLVR